MEPQETTVEADSENAIETLTASESTTPSASTESPGPITTPTSEVTAPQITIDIWKQVKHLWEQYFGEGKKSNLTLAITIISTIPVLFAASALLDFLNKLPVLPSVFELVGFAYSIWFVYRYLLLANTRKELIDGILAWKHKVFG
ncbi:MAG: hypothetical protein DCF19_12830 [Pseudanabaena frigida]|uniref:Cyanobacterial aminoacyl-tRNA synthetase CAAD domain-containing protein n=1 Tax=Pseudanabaena frigida TaxID=945775 RepID=A0A2W4W4E5_9CYAN|nr:MAG: hypothetical protein DCF19_12830 [Pseudanabaena frigida]